jgi:hypothetical protein
MKNDSFDNQVRDKISHHEAPVPQGTWEAIAQKKKKRRRYPLFWLIMGVPLLSGTMLWFFHQNRSEQTERVVAHKNEQSRLDDARADIVTKSNNDLEKNNRNSVSVAEHLHPDSVGNKDIVQSAELSRPAKQNVTSDSRNDIAKANNDRVAQSKIDLTLISNSKKESGEKESDLVIEQSIATSSKSGKVYPVSKHNTPLSPDSKAGNKSSLQQNIITDDKRSDVLLAEKSLKSISYPEHPKTAGTRNGFRRDINAFDNKNLVMVLADSLKKTVEAMAVVPLLQKGTSKSFKKNNWLIDISIMPFMPIQQNQRLDYLARTDIASMQRTEYKADEIHVKLQPSMAYTIAVAKRIKGKLYIGAGLQYAMIKEDVELKGTETKTTYTEVQRLVNGPSGPELIKDTVETISTGTRTIDALNSYRFFSIPLSLRYKLMEKGTWSFQVNGGINMNISATYHNSIRGKLVGVGANGAHMGQEGNSIGFDLFAGFRVTKNYHALGLFAEPVLRYNLSRYNLTGMINRKFMHQAGLSVGITYKLAR